MALPQVMSEGWAVETSPQMLKAFPVSKQLIASCSTIPGFVFMKR